MSSAGRAVSSNGCVTKPKEREIGLTGCAVSIRSSSLTGSYVMETAEHREPYESRGSRTVLGAPGGETPTGDSTFATDRRAPKIASCPQCPESGGWPSKRRLSRWASKRHRFSESRLISCDVSLSEARGCSRPNQTSNSADSHSGFLAANSPMPTTTGMEIGLMFEPERKHLERQLRLRARLFTRLNSQVLWNNSKVFTRTWSAKQRCAAWSRIY